MAFPVDDITLDAVENALKTSVSYDDGDNMVLVGGDYTLNMLLDFLSGQDAEKDQEHLIGYADDIPIYRGQGVGRYSEHCVIQALVDEVRRLRNHRTRDEQ